MARVKLSEYDTKRLLFPDSLVFQATSTTTSGQIKKGIGSKDLVIKVDQGVKKRGKQGLVSVGVTTVEAVGSIRKWSDLGYSQFIVEPRLEHDSGDERFLSLERSRSGWKVLYSDEGGIDIESNWDSITTKLPHTLHDYIYSSLIPMLDRLHIATLEINPFIVKGNTVLALDAAAELDDAALSLPDLTPLNLRPIQEKSKSKSELAVASLDASTPASLKYRLIEPQGRIWMLLSGGGASLVLADEVADLGLGKELANYGEYSGAPSEDDTYAYTKIILQDLLKVNSTSPKALVIAGGVANFTDVAKTFQGIIRALDSKKKELVKSKVQVFVRRGGPNEKKGLSIMRDFLSESRLLGSVTGHDTPLTNVVLDVKGYLS